MIDTNFNLNIPINVLKMLQRDYPDAIIAGGAVRDLYFHQLARDIDIFIQDPSTLDSLDRRPFPTKNVLRSLFELKDYKNMTRPIMGDCISKGNFEDYVRINKVRNVFDILKDMLPLQVIVLSVPPIEYVEKYFDIGLCKAYCDGTKISYTSDFMKDAQNKTLTILGQDMSKDEFNYTMDVHLPRIAHRFPGFTTKIASHNNQFVS